MKQKNRGEAVLGAGLALLLFGCGSTHHLGYDTAAVPAQPGSSINAVLMVEAFEDARRQNEPAVVFTGKDFPVVVNGTTYCLTLEAGYGGKVTDDLRSVIERHVRQRGVIAAWNAQAEKYRLDGTVAALLGQIVSPKRAYGGLLGVSGLIVEGVATQRTGQIDIVFQNLRLTRVRDGAIRPLPDVAIHFKGQLSGTSYDDCLVIFEYLDQHLKPAVDELAASVEQSIRDWPTDKP
jgi:hypothetical protein